MSEPARPQPRYNILIVDDEPVVLKITATALQGQYVVYTARNQAEARAVLADFEPHLLILDVRLGVENGLQILAEFRQRSLAPVLVVTGHGSEAVAADALQLRANAYLPKPFSIDELRTQVAALLAQGPRPEHLAERARALMDMMLRQPLSTTVLAERLGTDPRQLVRVFRERFGRTPMEYLRQARLQRAQELLLTTRESIEAIGSEVGFSYANYFARAFRREFGVSPVAFRRAYRLTGHHASPEPPPAK